MSKILKSKIQSKKCRIAVVGLGYIGLPIAMSFSQRGFEVIGIDADKDRVDSLVKRKSYITDVSSRQLSQAIKKKKFSATTKYDDLENVDAILVCVPTPLRRKYTPDISYILRAIRSIRKKISKDTLVILESTTYPGTTEELIKPELEKSGFKVGKDIFLSFSPERIDPGRKTHDLEHIPKVIGGMTEKCSQLTHLLYKKVFNKLHIVSSSRAAEMTKLLENSFRIINIGWMNEVAVMCNKMGIDVWEVVDAAKTKPFGFMPFYPGLGVGGHCIPDDPLYLYWKAKKYGFHSKFIKLAADVNSHMPLFAVNRIEEVLRGNLAKKKILICGITYKKDVNDLRKSPPLKLIDGLRRRHAKVDFYDPIVARVKIGGKIEESVGISPQKIKKYDCVVIAVDHSKVDYAMIERNAKRIFDIKNVYSSTKKKVIRF